MNRLSSGWPGRRALGAFLVGVVLCLPGATSRANAASQTVNYQGELKRAGVAYTGTAQMKFALVVLTGDPHAPFRTTWSNDGTSVAGAEPTSSLPVSVSEGVFSVMLGATPMRALDATAFASDPQLRVWVSTDGAPFEVLSHSLAGVPYAFSSNGAAGWTVVSTPSGSFTQITQRVSIGASSGYPAADLVVAGSARTNGLVVSGATSTTSLGVSGAASVGTLSASSTVSAPTMNVSGTVTTGVLEITGGDLAEPFPVTGEASPGTLLVMDVSQPGRLMPCRVAYDRTVVGVVSGAGGIAAGIRMYRAGQVEGTVDVALTGRVYVKASAEAGAIRPGDMLTTSGVRGHAMKAVDLDRSRGAVIGKAMSPLSEGTGMVLVLVQPQ